MFWPILIFQYCDLVKECFIDAFGRCRRCQLKAVSKWVTHCVCEVPRDTEIEGWHILHSFTFRRNKSWHTSMSLCMVHLRTLTIHHTIFVPIGACTSRTVASTVMLAFQHSRMGDERCGLLKIMDQNPAAEQGEVSHPLNWLGAHMKSRPRS